jgi:hypothetical protein
MGEQTSGALVEVISFDHVFDRDPAAIEVLLACGRLGDVAEREAPDAQPGDCKQ